MKVTGEVKSTAVSAAIRRRSLNVFDYVGRAIEASAIDLVAYVKRNKLSDQVLHVRTGRLRRSITYRLTKEGDVVTAYVGTNVKYARAHEYGFQGEVSVPAHTVKAHQRHMSVAFGKLMKNPRMVDVREYVMRAHSMKMNLPERSFLRSSVEENASKYTDWIKDAMVKGMQS